MPVLAGPQRSGATAPGLMAAGTVPPSGRWLAWRPATAEPAHAAPTGSRSRTRRPAPPPLLARVDLAARHPVTQNPGARSTIACGRRRSAAPDAVLADVPVPQRQLRVLGAYQATGAGGDRRGRLAASLGWLDADREPLAGVEAAVRAAGLPNHSGPHKASPVTWRRGRSPATGSASPDDRKREPWRAAAVHQVGAPVPVDAVHIGLGQPRWDPEPGELCHSPLVHQQAVVVIA